MKYLSLFSGIGGLEAKDLAPELACEIDPEAQKVLARRFDGTELHDDVTTLDPPEVDVVAGGWPCQDISVAGLQRGLAGEKSGLFFELLRVAERARAHTVIAENVPNLLRLERGEAFDLVLRSLEESGYGHIAWRTINAREFGLPHERRRIFIIASKYREHALALHRPYGEVSAPEPEAEREAAGFYWTAGLHSINYSLGYVPTLKVGSSLSIPSPPAVHFDGVVRKATAPETLRLQGFDPADFDGVAAKHLYRMSGNAVAAPVGHWVFDSVRSKTLKPPSISGFGFTGDHGIYENGTKKAVRHPGAPLAANLRRFLDLEDRDPLSVRASAGLVRRLLRSGKPCPTEIFQLLMEYGGSELEPEYLRAATARVGGDDTARIPRENEAASERSATGSEEVALELFA